MRRTPPPTPPLPRTPPAAPLRRRLGLALWLALALHLSAAPLAALAQRVDLLILAARRTDAGLLLDYQARLNLSQPIEEALQSGVALYFLAEAQVLRPRWYWRDERIARVSRSWRLSYQPLTASWRVGLGGLSQVYGSLAEALVPIVRASGWRLAEAAQLEAGEHYTVEFALKLDSTQLPRPMQLDLGGDWKLGVERVLRVD